MAKAENIGKAKPNPISGDAQGKAKQTYIPLGYKKVVGGGLDQLGDRGKQTHFDCPVKDDGGKRGARKV
jgi:hypothetical protein